MLYKIKRFDLWVARWFIKSKYISLVNLLADDEVFPEYLTWRDVSGELARWALAWLDDSEARSRATTSLVTLRHRSPGPGLGPGGPAYRRVAARKPSGKGRGRQVPYCGIPIAVPTTRLWRLTQPSCRNRNADERPNRVARGVALVNVCHALPACFGIVMVS